MPTSRLVRLIIGLGICLGLYSIFPVTSSQAQQPANDVAIDNDDIGGVVNGPKGPEAGVWVIAETRDLPVRYIKSVVTDDRGRFVVPDLPQASYSVWARGYGLVDSTKTTAKPGQRLAITATAAPNEAAAAHYYPAIYWYSMLKIPDAEQFGGKNSGISARLTQTQWISAMKNTGCIGCHQLGQQSTRTIPAALGTFASGADAWRRRVQSGQSGQQMLGQLTGLGDMSFANYGDWIDRIAKGELPFAKPPRPQGVERNIVVTLRDWMNDKQYLHDLIASDRRFPTVNAYGPLVGSPEYSSDVLPILDPVKNVATTFKAPVRDTSMPLSLGPGHAAALDALQPSPYWGTERIWDTRVNNHNSMFGRDGRLWLAASVRAPENPAFCKQGSDHPSAKAFPMERAIRHLAVFDLEDEEVHLRRYLLLDSSPAVRLRRQRHDLDERRRPRRWLAELEDVRPDRRRREVAGMDGTRAGHERQRQARRVRRAGRASRSHEGHPDQLRFLRGDAQSGRRLSLGTRRLVFPARWCVLRRVLNPPETALAEIYSVPMPGFGARGADIDSKGVVWVSLGSGHMGSFDRRKCKGPLNGPKATGDHCPEGWSFHQYPGPGFKGIGENSAESSYYSWVDQHNTFGLGNDVPMSTGNLNDGIIAFANGRMVVLRVPYPIGFYAKGFDGRIDDPKAGWKGRGLWAANGDRTPWLIEGGKGTKPLAAHFQLRPDPLAK